MLFFSPIWLWGLLPWTAVVIYLLTGRGRAVVVPFLGFWRASATVSHSAAWRVPPVFVLLMLLAMLLAVLAAAEPGYRSAAGIAGDVSIVLDCGASMARPGAGGEPFRGVVDRCAKMLGPVAGRVSITPVPGQRVETTGADWVAAAKRFSPTAIPVNLDQPVTDCLRQTRGLVVVLSDQHLTISDPRLVQIVPDVPAPAVAITRLAARSQPRPQVMVRLENHSELQSVRVIVKSGANSVARQIQLKPNGNSQDEFFDLPAVDQFVTAEVDPHLRLDPWSKAFLVRQSAGIRLAVIGDVPAAVRRMVAVYSRDRSANAEAADVFVSDHPPGENQPGVWIDGSPGDEATGAVDAVPNAITKDIAAWPAKGVRGSVPPDYSAVVSVGGNPMVAVRDDSVRRVWIRADLKDWVKTVDFVSFFANVFDWIPEADRHETSVPPEILGGDWKSVHGSAKPPAIPTGAWPGEFRSDAGEVLAVNAGNYPVDSTAVDAGVARLPTATSANVLSLLPAMIFGSLACALLAMFFWPGRRVAV
jgi:hypothetical protein